MFIGDIWVNDSIVHQMGEGFFLKLSQLIAETVSGGSPIFGAGITCNGAAIFQDGITCNSSMSCNAAVVFQDGITCNAAAALFEKGTVSYDHHKIKTGHRIILDG